MCEAVSGANQPPPRDTALLDLLRAREGQRTTVVLADGKRLTVLNIAWGYDMGDEFAHVTTNISPEIEGTSAGFFFTHDVRELCDEGGEPLDLDLRGIGRADAQSGQLLPITEDEDAFTVTIGRVVVQGWIDDDPCDRCGAAVIMDEANDAKFCPQCNRWVESKCDDPKCEYCPFRPEPPLNRKVEA